MIEQDPNRRSELILNRNDIERYKALFDFGLDGVVDDWFLEKFDYDISADEIVTGKATFRKLIRA